MNGILVINKEKGYTSRDVVNIVSKTLNIKKVGHTGTLDPIATGVLVICIGKYTKLVNLLTSKDKEYIATMQLGIKTDTLDITGEIIEEKSYSVNEEKVRKILQSFLGKSMQQVPIYSAIKIKGKKLYEYARNNEKVILPKREINIKKIELLKLEENTITFKAIVSKGTYIRSLINDIAKRLGTVGTMTKLNRIKQGLFSIEDAVTIEEFKNNNFKFFKIEDVINDLQIVEIDEFSSKLISNGAIIDKNFTSKYCLFKNNKTKGDIALYIQCSDNKYKAKPYIIF